MNTILSIPSQTINSIIQKTLESYGHNVHLATAGNDILDLLHRISTDLLIIDGNMEGTDCPDLCRKIREKYHSLLVMGIISNGPWERKIELLNSGADDCLSFPFPTQELVARIQSLLRRPHISEKPKYIYGNLTLDPTSMKTEYLSEPLDLTKKEYMLMEYMMRNRNRPVSRSELLDHIWDYNRITTSNTVDVHITKIRKKMNSIIKYRNQNRPSKSLGYVSEQNIGLDSPSNTEIRTVHGIGYQLENNIDSGDEEMTSLPEL